MTKVCLISSNENDDILQLQPLLKEKGYTVQQVCCQDLKSIDDTVQHTALSILQRNDIIIMEGPLDYTKSFIAGFMAAKGKKVIYCSTDMEPEDIRVFKNVCYDDQELLALLPAVETVRPCGLNIATSCPCFISNSGYCHWIDN